MSVIVRGGGTKLAPLKAAVTCLASSMDMALWHAGARRPKTTVSARLAHEIGRVRRSTMAGLRLIDARAGRFLHRTLGHSDQAVNNRCGKGWPGPEPQVVWRSRGSATDHDPTSTWSRQAPGGNSSCLHVKPNAALARTG